MTKASASVKLATMHRFVAILLIASALPVVGCSNQPILRDHYFGKNWLQPDKVTRPHPRDKNGNPQFEQPFVHDTIPETQS